MLSKLNFSISPNKNENLKRVLKICDEPKASNSNPAFFFMEKVKKESF